MPTSAAVLAIAFSLAVVARSAAPQEAPSGTPSSVTVAGSLQSELGCGGDWNPACATTHLAYDANDGVWQGIFAIPAGSYEYLAAIDDSWTEHYGQHGLLNGPNIPLSLAATTAVKFYYSDATHWVTDDVGSVIAVAPGSFQSELGCPGDWSPDCLRSWLQDLDGDGIYRLTARGLPSGNYEFKVAIDESWTENYGQGGVPNGPNILFSVAPGYQIDFFYNATTHVPTWTTSLFADDFELHSLSAWSTVQP